MAEALPTTVASHISSTKHATQVCHTLVRHVCSHHDHCALFVAGQEYSQVIKMLGNGRCECFCFDGVTRLGHIRGKMRKKVWITAGDIVLVAKRDFQDEKVDIVHKYTADEARNLKQYGELPETARINETAVDMAMAGTPLNVVAEWKRLLNRTWWTHILLYVLMYCR